MTTPSLRVYPLLYLPHLDLCHIKTIYGPYMGHPRSKNWTLDFAPAFSQRVSFPLSPRSFFHTRQRFLLPNHVTSGCMSPRSFFHTWSAVSPSQKHVTSGSGYDVILTSKRGKRLHTSAPYYYLLSERMWENTFKHMPSHNCF